MWHDVISRPSSGQSEKKPHPRLANDPSCLPVFKHYIPVIVSSSALLPSLTHDPHANKQPQDPEKQKKRAQEATGTNRAVHPEAKSRKSEACTVSGAIAHGSERGCLVAPLGPLFHAFEWRCCFPSFFFPFGGLVLSSSLFRLLAVCSVHLGVCIALHLNIFLEYMGWRGFLFLSPFLSAFRDQLINRSVNKGDEECVFAFVCVSDTGSG